MHNPQQFVEDFDRKLKAFQDRHKKPTTPEQVEAERKYWERVFSDDASSPKARTPQVRQEMDYDMARRKVWGLFEQRADEIAILENNPNFQWDFSGGKGEKIGGLIRYFINDPKSPYHLSKGLYVYGHFGTTKTETMRIMEQFCKKEGLTKQFVFCSMSKIYVDTKSSKEHDPITPNVQNNRCFDEFGLYIGPVTRFGETIDPTEAILEQRYIRWRNYGQLSFFISNATPEKIKPQLSHMVSDRLGQMITPVVFPGESKR